MGSSVSCCRRGCRIGSNVDNGHPRNKKYPDGRGSSSHSHLHSISALVPGAGKLNSSTVRRNYSNHFTLASTKESLEFVHGAKRPNFNSQISGVDEEGFHFHHLIDTGGFGFVFKATRKTTGETYALKVQPMEFMAKLTRAGGHRKANEVSLQMEKTALATCRGHPFIVSLEYSFHTSLYAILALEYVQGGTLSRLIINSPKGRLPCDLARIYTAEIALALNFMHQKGIIYRDVKPPNVLIDLDGHIKVTDFGLAGSMLAKKKQVVNPQENNPQEKSIEMPRSTCDEDRDSSEDESMGDESLSSEEPEWTDDEATYEIKGDLRRVRRRTLCGTAGYRPPEQVGERYVDYQNRSGYDERVDFFSLGVTAFTMVCGQRPFPSRKMMMSEVNGISSTSRTRKSLVSDHQTSALRRAEMRKLMKDIEFRCLMKEVKFPDFPVAVEAKSLIEQLLSKDPNVRPRFEDFKNHPWFQASLGGEGGAGDGADAVEFDAAKLKGTKLPDWVLKQVQQESKARPKSMRRNSVASQPKTDLSLGLFIEDICTQLAAMGKDEDAENAATRWMTVPSSSTKGLFRHWGYISDDALKLEANAAKNAQPMFASRRFLRRATQ